MPNRPPHCCRTPGCARLAYHGSLCEEHAKKQQRQQETARPTSTQRGYGSKWQKKRATFLLANPHCEDCGRIATDVDHEPSRRELVQMGVTDPDADEYLHSRCHSDHTRKTNKQDGGGWHGRRIKSLRP